MLAPATLRDYGMGPQFQADARVFLFAALLAMATMLLLSLVPLSQVARTQLLPVLRSQALHSPVAGRPRYGVERCGCRLEFHSHCW